MRTTLLAVLLISAAACSKSERHEQESHRRVDLPTITIDEVNHGLASGECQAVDANGDATRKKLGVLPGAVLLSDSEEFKLSELPTDKTKTLVFYCANTHCGASHTAAEKALTAGYTRVKVMPDGIAGWVKAGKQTQQL